MTAQEINNRVDEVSFNASLLAELRAADFVARLIRKGLLKSDEYREERLHRIGGAGKLEFFNAATKNDVSWHFLKRLRELGRNDAKEWLEENFDKIGVESTLDMNRALRRDLGSGADQGRAGDALIGWRVERPQRFLNAASALFGEGLHAFLLVLGANSEWKMRRSKRTPSASVVS